MEFQPHPDRDGLDIHDPIENVRFALFTPESVRPTPVEPTSFYFPVDAAVAIETTTLEVPKPIPVTVRRQDGSMVVETADGRDRTLAADGYLVELTTTPMKLYLSVTGACRIEYTDSSAVFRFDEAKTVRVGARSHHDRPAGTITVTDDVRDAMRAVSLFGSALKTTSPERSFPTLRGHPPLVERADAFSAPPDLTRPETDVRLVVPPDREHLYPVVSLAYYLGAEVVPGATPRLVVGSFERPPEELDAVHDADDRRIPPGMPAERLEGDPELAVRTRDRAPTASFERDDRDGESTSAVEAFLEDDEKIAAIQEQARAEAERQAAEWGLDEQLGE
ncbi:hypothetical protein [Haladaptatus sp. NG-WS-4]